MQYKRVVSFGDSFIFGDELLDDFGTTIPTCVVQQSSDYPEKYKILIQRAVGQRPEAFNERASQSTWPALVSKDLNIPYECYAISGASNQTILRQLLTHLDNLTADDLVVIGWTFIDRWDFYYNDEWVTIRPDTEHEVSKIYFKYVQSELWDKWETLKSISLVQTLLKERGINFLMTCQDTLINDANYNIDTYIDTLRNIVRNDIVWFDNCGFNEWAKGYPRGKNGHPLEEAHQAAFEYIRENYDFTK